MVKKILRFFLNFVVFFAFSIGAAAMYWQLTAKPMVAKIDQTAGERLPVVQVEVVSRQPYHPKIKAVATVEALQAGDVVAEASGRLIALTENFVVGRQVTEGMLLAKIDPSDYEAAIIQAEASVNNAQAVLDQELARAEVAKADLTRAGRRVANNPLAARVPQVAAARSALASAQSTLDTAQKRLDKTAIYAPFSGEIAAKMVVVGQQIGAGTPIAKLLSTQQKRLILPLTAEQIDILNAFKRTPDAAIVATLNANDVDGRSQTWTLPVDEMASAIDAKSQLATVYITIPKTSTATSDLVARKLSIGSRVALTLSVADAREVITVPIQALGQRNQVRLLASPDARELQSVTVQPLWWGDERVVIRAGIQSGDVVVITPMAASILDGSRVRLDTDPPVSDPSSERVIDNNSEPSSVTPGISATINTGTTSTVIITTPPTASVTE